MTRIKPDYRECVQARILEQRSYSEIAASLGISEEVVRARVSRGLKQLKKELADVRNQAHE
jgi:RNA polymerase sigma-70 factor (ECF subfamily)